MLNKAAGQYVVTEIQTQDVPVILTIDHQTELFHPYFFTSRRFHQF